jgi:hypothetical protein
MALAFGVFRCRFGVVHRTALFMRPIPVSLPLTVIVVAADTRGGAGDHIWAWLWKLVAVSNDTVIQDTLCRDAVQLAASILVSRFDQPDDSVRLVIGCSCSADHDPFYALVLVSSARWRPFSHGELLSCRPPEAVVVASVEAAAAAVAVAAAEAVVHPAVPVPAPRLPSLLESSTQLLACVEFTPASCFCREVLDVRSFAFGLAAPLVPAGAYLLPLAVCWQCLPTTDLSAVLQSSSIRWPFLLYFDAHLGVALWCQVCLESMAEVLKRSLFRRCVDCSCNCDSATNCRSSG